MKYFAIIALVLFVGCADNTVTGPTASPSPSPVVAASPSPSPIPPVFAIVSIDAIKNGASIDSWHPGDNIELRGSVTCFDEAQQVTNCPFISEWNWQNFSGPDALCRLFGQVQSRNPHVVCDDRGTFMVMASPMDIDGKSIGISQLFIALVR